MKSLCIAIGFLMMSQLAYSQTRLYNNPDFDQIARDHKIIAVLPFHTSIHLRPRQMREITAEQLEIMELAEGEMIQYALHAWFLKRDKRGSLKVDLQDPKKTNILLADAGISVYDIEHYLPEELAEILEVDAVVMGTFETNKPMSEEAAVALKMIFGIWGKTNAAMINLSIHNGADGMLLVNYNKGVSRSFGSTPGELVNTLMRKASRRIAYTRG